MVSFSDIFLAIVIIFDFVVSLWNAYASGVTWTLLKNKPGQRFAKAAAIAGLGLAFAGMCYAILIIASFLALFVGILAVGDVLFIVSFDFLVFAAMIIGFGLVVTAQSIAIAYRTRNWGAIAISAWNVFAEIWDITIYARGFSEAASVVKDGRGKINLYAIIVAAVGVAFLITFAAYRQGVRKAEDSIAANPDQAASEVAGPAGSPGLHTRHPRTLAIVGCVVVVIVVALIIAVITYPAANPKVHVSEIDVWTPDNVCGYGANPVAYAGFDDVGGSSDAFALQLHNFNTTACTVQGVTTNTSGFGLSNVGTPVTVPGLQNGTLDLTIILPSGSFSGVLNLIYT